MLAVLCTNDLKLLDLVEKAFDDMTLFVPIAIDGELFLHCFRQCNRHFTVSCVPALQKEKIREDCLIHRRSYGFWWFFLLSSFQCVVCIAHGELFFSFALCGGVLIPVFTPLFFLNHTMKVVFRYALVLILILHPPKYFNFFHFCY